MRFAFWNTKRNRCNQYITSLVRDYSIDLLVLAEYEDDKEELMSDLGFESLLSAGCKRINMFSRRNVFSPGPQSTYYSIQIVNNDYLLCCMHLPSRRFDQLGDDRGLLIDQLLMEVERLKEQNSLSNAVFLGDLNDDPYDKNVLAANKLHALPSIKDLDKEKRVIMDNEYVKYYNPMWNLLGDKNGPPGTYYFDSSDLTNSFWHMLDQVIISKGLFNRFLFDELKIITETSYGPLINEKGRPLSIISDHLPLIFEIGDADEKSV